VLAAWDRGQPADLDPATVLDDRAAAREAGGLGDVGGVDDGVAAERGRLAGVARVAAVIEDWVAKVDDSITEFPEPCLPGREGIGVAGVVRGWRWTSR
jgi:hypothetical protein